MNTKRISGIVGIALGVCIYLFGSYIAGQVEQGNRKISGAEKSVTQTKKLTSLSPYTKDAGNLATSPIQKKIDSGKAEASYYQALAMWLHVGGAILIIAGAGLVVVSYMRK